MKRVTQRSRRRTLTDDHVDQLSTGGDHFGAAFNTDLGLSTTVNILHPNAPDNLLNACREAWQQLRAEVLEHHRQRRLPGTRPAAWWRFDSPERRNRDESEYDQLLRLGFLSDDELAAYHEVADDAGDGNDDSLLSSIAATGDDDDDQRGYGGLIVEPSSRRT